MLIICTIVYSTTPPSAAPLPRLLIPKSLVLSYASLFDDPDYSDVVFRIKAPGKKERLLFAAKKILARSQYFDTSKLILSTFLDRSLIIFNSVLLRF